MSSKTNSSWHCAGSPLLPSVLVAACRDAADTAMCGENPLNKKHHHGAKYMACLMMLGHQHAACSCPRHSHPPPATVVLLLLLSANNHIIYGNWPSTQVHATGSTPWQLKKPLTGMRRPRVHCWPLVGVGASLAGWSLRIHLA